MDRRFAVELLVHHKARPDWDHFVSTDVARFLVQLLLLFGFFYLAPWERFEALRRQPASAMPPRCAVLLALNVAVMERLLPWVGSELYA